MLCTGVDIVEVERISRSAQRYGEQFYQRLFTPAEREYCGERYVALAARFAAKEAVVKALGTGIGDITWVHIEIVNDSRGRPGVTLHAAAAERAAELGLTEWSVSLSHTNEHAIAFVVATG